MMYTATTTVQKILAMPERVKIIQGGSSAGKTIAILLILIDRAQVEEGQIFSIVSESMPHLKKGAMRDFLNIMEGHGYYKEENWNRTDSIYTFETGTKIEFFSADTSEKVRGPRRQVLFINEANNIDYETFTQLSIRTSGDIYIDYNPVAQFWVHDEVIPFQKHSFLIVTYKDNEGLPQSTVDDLESRKHRTQWWNVYGLGLIGEVEGKIYKNWAPLEEIPAYAQLVRRGIDFGYTNDPTAIIDVYKFNGGYILDEIAYQKGLSNKAIADIVLSQEQVLCVGDSSEPKSIDELKLYGVSIIGATKGPGSINQGIQLIQDSSIYVTKRSVNLQKEQRGYFWMPNVDEKKGKLGKKPQDWNNHALDAARYAISSLHPLESFDPVLENKIRSNRGNAQRYK